MPIKKNLLSKTKNPLFPNMRDGMLLGYEQTIPINRNLPMIDSYIEEEQPEQDDANFLGSLISQGVASLGAGIQGRDITQLGRIFDINRQESFRQNQYQKQKQKANSLIDPNSKESVRRRMIYGQALGVDIPDNYSATDLSDPIVLRSIQEKKMQAMPPKGGTGIGGVAQGKPEKEVKSNQKLLDDYTEHAQSLRSSIDVMDAVNKLNRTRIGKYTPDFSTNTQAQSGTVDRAGAGLVKVLAGAGTVSDSDFARLKDLVPNSNMTKDLAKETAKNQTLEGTNKSLARLRLDRDLGRINETDFKKIINQYNRYLKDPKLELNKQINIDTGEIEDISSPNKVKFSEEQ